MCFNGKSPGGTVGTLGTAGTHGCGRRRKRARGVCAFHAFQPFHIITLDKKYKDIDWNAGRNGGGTVVIEACQ